MNWDAVLILAGLVLFWGVVALLIWSAVAA